MAGFFWNWRMNERPKSNGIGAELGQILERGRKVWELVPRRHKLALGGAALIMALTSAGNTALPLLMGTLVDSIQTGVAGRQAPGPLFQRALWVLGMIAAVYVVREVLHIFRRYLVENSCTRINRDMSLRLIAHIMKGDLGALTKDKVGALHGRIFRSVDGLVRFLRL